MLEKNKYFARENVLSNQDIVKDTIIKLHDKNKDDVPKFLDDLQDEKKLTKKEAKYDNDFLKYMI